MDKWSEKQSKLLALEQEQGLAQHELRKVIINKLQLSDVRVGSFVKTVLLLERTKPIGVGAISPGSPVRVFSPRWGARAETEVIGVVKSCEEYSIEVVCKLVR